MDSWQNITIENYIKGYQKSVVIGPIELLECFKVSDNAKVHLNTSWRMLNSTFSKKNNEISQSMYLFSHFYYGGELSNY